MKQTFLQEFAKELIDQQESLKNVAVVLPSRRTGVFLKKQLQELAPKAAWLPSFITISELLGSLSPYERIGKIDQLVHGFRAYQNVIPKEKQDRFEKYLSWAGVMINDFNEIDHHLITAKDIFKDLRKIKYTESWSFNSIELSENQEEYLLFWNSLYPIYKEWKKLMTAEGVMNGGGIAKEVAETSEELKLPYDHLYVVGLNALTAAEQKVVGIWESQSLASVYFDGDEFYTNDPDQEAGIFIRQAQEKLKVKPIGKNFVNEEKLIETIECSSSISQAKYCMTQLAVLSEEELQKTALILPDESILPAVIESIPSNVKTVNISMGFPLKNTPLQGLLSVFFRLISSNRGNLRYSDFLTLIRHPYMRTSAHLGRVFKAYEKDIAHHNIIFIDQKTAEKYNWDNELDDWLKPIAKAAKSKTATDTATALEHLFNSAKVLENSELTWHLKVRKQVLSKAVGLLKQLERFQNKYNVLNTRVEYRFIFLKLFGQEQLDMIGEPLEGLQIMGLLESRALDFERTFIFTCNEGILPKRNFLDSYMPMDVRNYYKLPSPADREAIFAYYFYRCLQRANHSTLMYSEGEKNTDKSGEKSRYLQQLQYHFASHPIVHLKSKVLQLNNKHNSNEIQALPSNKWVKSRIKEIMAAGLSPSAIDKWLICNKDFFYRYVLGLGEQSEAEETMENSTLGTIVHDVLELVFKDYVGKTLDLDCLEEIKNSVPEVLSNTIAKHYNTRLTRGGENFLIVQVIKQYIAAILKAEKKNLPAKLVALEGEFKFKVFDDPKMIIKGKADRIDEKNGILKVIDYKTGKVAATDLKVKTLEELQKSDKGKARQILLYALMTSNDSKFKNTPVDAGIISAKNVSSGFIPLRIGKQAFYQLQEQEVIDWLKTIQENLLDTNEIVHNPEAKYCQYCVPLGAEKE